AIAERAVLYQGEAALEPSLPHRVVLHLRQRDNRPHGIPHAGRSQHLKGRARRDRDHVPGKEVRLTLLEDARSEILRMQTCVLELELGMRLRERLEGPLVAVAG